ncbi:MAG: hypothetical protein U0796_04720 [Gemmatales bacterium]
MSPRLFQPAAGLCDDFQRLSAVTPGPLSQRPVTEKATIRRNERTCHHLRETL